MRACGTDFNNWIDKARWSHDLLNHIIRMTLLIITWRCGNENALAHARFKLFHFEWSIIHRGWQTETIGDKRLFAGAVAAIHTAELANRDMALVNKHQGIARQIINERWGWVAWCGTRQVARIVFDPLAET